MSRPTILPFLTLTDSSIVETPWILHDNLGRMSVDAGAVAGWDYASPLTFERKLHLDWDKIVSELGLSAPPPHLLIRVLSGTGSGTLPRNITCVHFTPVEPLAENICLEIALDSSQLSERLRLETQILLGKRPDSPGTLSPTVPGARLWESHEEFNLETSDPVFPMEYVSFNAMFGNGMQAGALWYLSWSPDALERDFRGAVRLYLNEDRADFVDRINSHDRVVLQAVLGDVMCHMAEQALLIDEYDERIRAADDNTVGGHVKAWLKSGFGNATPQQARSMLELRPSDFRARLQSVAELPEIE